MNSVLFQRRFTSIYLGVFLFSCLLVGMSPAYAGLTESATLLNKSPEQPALGEFDYYRTSFVFGPSAENKVFVQQSPVKEDFDNRPIGNFSLKTVFPELTGESNIHDLYSSIYNSRFSSKTTLRKSLQFMVLGHTGTRILDGTLQPADQTLSLGPRDSRSQAIQIQTLNFRVFEQRGESTRPALLRFSRDQQVDQTLQYRYMKSFLRFLS